MLEVVMANNPAPRNETGTRCLNAAGGKKILKWAQRQTHFTIHALKQSSFQNLCLDIAPTLTSLFIMSVYLAVEI